jgi:AraC-like DNA-binding protein
MKASTKEYYLKINETIKSYITNNLDRPITLKSISKEFAISLFHLTRIFRSLNGTTLAKYILDKRLHRSLQEVRHTSRRIGDIALDNGFNGYETFSRQFKRKYKVAPDDLRNILLRICRQSLLFTKPIVILQDIFEPLSESEISRITDGKRMDKVRLLQFEVSENRGLHKSKEKFQIKDLIIPQCCNNS